MTMPRKSPNMMSTTGRMPVIAAPTPIPVIPASEIGESMIRCGPNSSTSPESTLNGVPASATSSPMTNTVGSRRSSSARASRTAWENVISRTASPRAPFMVALGVDMLVNLPRIWEGGVESKLYARLDLGLCFCPDGLKRSSIGHRLFDHPVAQQRDWVALGLPEDLL